MDTMADWYGLKAGHNDFFIQNDLHAGLLFARSQLDNDLQGILRKSFRTGNPPKFVLYGDWGIGKTHTMRHIEHVIKTTPGFDAVIAFKDFPDITSKSTFQVAHEALLDAIGLNTVRNWMTQFQTKNQSKSEEAIKQQTQSEDIARAFLTLSTYGEAARISWDWLRGIDLTSQAARSAGLPPVLAQSNQLVNVLRMLGRLSIDIDGKILILMLDEATKLKSVSNGDAIGHWVNAFKILSDKLTKEVGFIVSASFRDPDDMPEPLSDQQIKTRFGEKHYIQLLTFDAAAAEEFTRALLAEWVDPPKRMALRAKYEAAEADGEPVSDASFPFTEKAIKSFIEYACRNGNTTWPRDLQQTLDDFLNRAIDDGKHILSRRYLDGVNASG